MIFASGVIITIRTLEKTVAGRVQNLRPWPKGVSGNPAGRPKNDISVEIARAVFENNAEAIYRGLARRLAKGDARVFKVLAERAYGKVPPYVCEDREPRVILFGNLPMPSQSRASGDTEIKTPILAKQNR